MKKWLITTVLASSVGLAACGQSNDTDQSMNHNETSEEMSHDGMNHSSSEGAPASMKDATTPKFPVKSQVIMNTAHMPGMEGQKATVSGAYDTTVYSVSYTPITGGKAVKNHKWVVHEELKDARQKPYQKGDEVTLAAKHMDGMNGATATIDSATNTTVYMVDYKDADGNDIKNHKWVTEDELTAAK